MKQGGKSSAHKSRLAFSFGKQGGLVMKYICDVCEWVYDEAAGDPDNGIAPGTKFEDLPEDFVCPLCGVGKDMFTEAE